MFVIFCCFIKVHHILRDLDFIILQLFLGKDVINGRIKVWKSWIYALAIVMGWMLSHVESRRVHAYVGVLDLVLASYLLHLLVLRHVVICAGHGGLVEALAILSADCLIVEVLSIVRDTASLRLGCQIINWVMFLQSLSSSIGREPLLIEDLIYLIDVVFVEIFVKLLLARLQMRSSCVFLLSLGLVDLHLALIASRCSLSASLLRQPLIRLRRLRSQMSTLTIL